MKLQLPVVVMAGVALSGLERHVWEGYRVGEIRFQVFPASGAAQFPPMPRLRGNADEDFRWAVSAGRGTVVSWTVVHRPANPDSPTPYAPAIVELDEGFQMLACVAGCDSTELRVGARVDVRFADASDGYRVPYFVPRGDGDG
ncbi:MAG: OB-fold domain-containing protein [Actinomycetales bacterium]|nr:OB-fold domain-containing protein [Actinomycetales bacterium]